MKNYMKCEKNKKSVMHEGIAKKMSYVYVGNFNIFYA